MPISGTVPFYDFSLTRTDGVTKIVSDVTGLVVDGQAANANSNETHLEFLARGITALSLSGTLADDADTVSGLQCITAGALSGVMQFQRELAFRIADVNNLGAANSARLTAAQTALAVDGEVQFGA